MQQTNNGRQQHLSTEYAATTEGVDPRHHILGRLQWPNTNRVSSSTRPVVHNMAGSHKQPRNQNTGRYNNLTIAAKKTRERAVSNVTTEKVPLIGM